MKLKHCFQRVAAVMVCLVLFCNLASAAESKAPSYKQLTDEQLNSMCSITLNYKTLNSENPQPLPQTTFRLYQVADMNKNIQLTVTDAFKDQSLDYTAGWDKLASTLANYVADGSIAPTRTVSTGAQGEVTVNNLPVGLYLIVGEPSVATDSANSTKVTYTPTPILVALPNWINSDWDFDVDFTLKYTQSDVAFVNRRVLKIWNDSGNETQRPDSVTVHLLRNGQVYDTVTLNEENNWRYSWDELEAEGIVWSLTEDFVSSYRTAISQEGITFTVTNTYSGGGGGGGGGTDPTPPTPPTPPTDPDIDLTDPDVPLVDGPVIPMPPLDPVEEPEVEEPEFELEDMDVPLAEGPTLPQTGQLWWPVPLLAAGGVVLILAGVRRRQNGC